MSESSGQLQVTRPLLGLAPERLAQACLLTCSDELTGADARADEQARAARLVDGHGGERLLASLVSVRVMLGEVLGQDAGQLRLARTGAGAPYLPDWPGHNISISRSLGWTATALSEAGEIGVDIERVRDIDWRAMLDMLCSENERAGVLAAAGSEGAQTARFFRLWTIKEAVMKAMGLGFKAGPKGVGVPQSALEQARGSADVSVDGRAFGLYWTQAGGTVIALASGAV